MLSLIPWSQIHSIWWCGQKWFNNRCKFLFSILRTALFICYYNQYTQGTSILSPIIPLMLVYSFTLIIYSKSMSNAFVNYVAIYIITFGFVCAKITCKLVVSEPKRKIYNLNFHVHFSFLSRLHIWAKVKCLKWIPYSLVLWYYFLINILISISMN